MAALKESLKTIIEKLKDLKSKITTEVLAEGGISLTTELDALKAVCMSAHTSIDKAESYIKSNLTSYLNYLFSFTVAIAYVQNAVTAASFEVNHLVRASSKGYQSKSKKSWIKTILGHENKPKKT